MPQHINQFIAEMATISSCCLYQVVDKFLHIPQLSIIAITAIN